jgi:hypothetical protein
MVLLKKRDEYCSWRAMDDTTRQRFSVDGDLHVFACLRVLSRPMQRQLSGNAGMRTKTRSDGNELGGPT